METILKTSPLVDNMFVYAESSRNHVVAVVLPQLAPLRQLARRGVSASLAGASLAELCASEQLERQVQKVLAEHGRAGQSRAWGLGRALQWVELRRFGFRSVYCLE